MEKYDVIIIGAGIAGCGLAYNLKKFGYKGSVLIIDKKEIGGYVNNYRNTFEEVIKEYDLPYYHKFKGIKMGAYDKVYFSLDIDFYFIDYKRACSKLYKHSDAEFKKETALNLKDNILTTNDFTYKYDYLIDCSGSNLFIKKLFNKTLPFRYWIGNVKILDNKVKLSTKYFYYFFSNENFFEDFYPLGNKVVQGDWCYVNKVNFDLIQPHKKRFYDKYLKEPKIIHESKVIIPCTPVFPLVHKNIAFLGDSFGNATTSAAEGVRPILKTSKLLANSIIKSNLKLYEKRWKEMFFKGYYKNLISRMDINSNLKINKSIMKYPPYSQFLKLLGNHKDIVLKRLKNEECTLPIEIRKKFPLSSLLIRQLIYRTYAQFKYALM